MRLLVIDDERSIRNSLKEILMDEGYEVDVAEDGAVGCAMEIGRASCRERVLRLV